MNALITIVRREFAAYFATPLAYVFLVAFVVAAGAMTFYVGGFFGRSALALDDKVQYKAFTAALGAIESNYIEKVESDRLVYGAIRGMLSTLDPHSNFFDPKEQERFRENQRGQYFGVGIVKTVEDFGSQGDAPSNQELLDWLATEFVRTGWDVKAFQKTIVMSATYQQSSKTTPEMVDELRKRHDQFHALLQINLTVLATAHAVSESIMRGVSSELARKATPQAYGASGRATPSSPSGQRPLTLSRVL